MIRAEAETDRWREKLGERMLILFVTPDYHEAKPKKCMNGWGNVFLTIAPDGVALPCHTARMLPGLEFPNVRATSLREIWFESEGFNRYRGTGWMQEPCASCADKEKDLGGCRCQAFLLANDAAAADPVCAKSPYHHLVQEAVAAAEARAANWPARQSAVHGPEQGAHPLVYRGPKESRMLSRISPSAES